MASGAFAVHSACRRQPSLRASSAFPLSSSPYGLRVSLWPIRAGILAQSSAPAAVQSTENGIAQKLQNIRLPIVGRHRAAERHHERDRGIDLLLRPLLRRVEVASPIR